MTSMDSAASPDSGYTSSNAEEESTSSASQANISASDDRNLKTRGKRHHARASEESSPVLGLRILPVGELNKDFQGSHEVNERTAISQTAKKATNNGKFVCRLCSASHEDALSLARHKCSRIVNVRYRCEECGKTFGCPANLASHRRWHNPQNMAGRLDKSNYRRQTGPNAENYLPPFVSFSSFKQPESEKESKVREQKEETNSSSETFFKAIYPCQFCKRRFRRESNRRKHVLVKHIRPENAAKAGSTPMTSTDPQHNAANLQKGNPFFTSSLMELVGHSTIKTTLPIVTEPTNKRTNDVVLDLSHSKKPKVVKGCKESPVPVTPEFDDEKPLDLSVKSKLSSLKRCHSKPLQMDKIFNRVFHNEPLIDEARNSNLYPSFQHFANYSVYPYPHHVPVYPLNNSNFYPWNPEKNLFATTAVKHPVSR